MPFSRRDIDLLASVDQLKGMPQAARTLRATSSALARRLDRLDRRVGAPLSRRKPVAISLTSAGERVLAAGRRFYRELDRSWATIVLGTGESAAITTASRTLPLTTSQQQLEPIVEHAAAASGLLLSLRHAEPDQIALDLNAYRADAAYTWWHTDPRPGMKRALHAVTVIEEPLWVWLPVRHPLASRRVVTLAQLADDHWVSETGPTTEPLVAGVHRAAQLAPPTRMTIATSTVARTLLSRGQAVGLGAPLGGPTTSSQAVAVRLAEAPTRTLGLLIDPTVVPQLLVTWLAHAIEAYYLHIAHHEDHAVRRDSWWAIWHARQIDHILRRRSVDLALVRATVGHSEIEKIDAPDLRMLRSVAEQGSINRAAATLSISQPALTRRLHRLERRLDVTVSTRTARGTHVTAQVATFLQVLNVLEEEFRDAAHAVAVDRTGN